MRPAAERPTADARHRLPASFGFGAPAHVCRPAAAGLRVPLLLVVVAALAACAGPRKAGTPDDEPTLATLAGRSVAVDTTRRIDTSEAQALAAYRDFLATAPRVADARPRAEAMRRLGDLELDRVEAAAEAAPAPVAAGTATPPASAGLDTRAAIARYDERLRAFPQHPDNDRVLYQLARAQELGADLPAALATLDRLVAEHPASVHRAEAQFRRGELLFANQRWALAEAAYADVLKHAAAAPAAASNRPDTPAPASRPGAGEARPDGVLRDRALYMLGWSQFKQSRLPEALAAFFGVLDARLVPPTAQPAASVATPGAAARGGASPEGRANAPDDADLAQLSRGDRELVEDTLRVTSISLASLQGAESIPPFIDRDARRAYEPRIYRELGELYIRQDRIKDAADTFGAFTRRQPLHAQAPTLQARVIEIYERGGFANQAMQAKRDYVTRYGARSAFRQANPAGWAQAEARLARHLDDLARFHHAAAQKARAARDTATAARETQEAIRWYGDFIEAFPKGPDTPARHFLLAELLADDQRTAESAAAFERVAYAYPAHARSAEAGYAAVLARRSLAGVAPAGGAPAGLPAGHSPSPSAGSTAAADPASADARRQATDTALRFATTFPGDPRATAVLTDAADRLLQQGDLDGAARLARQVLAAGPSRPSASGPAGGQGAAPAAAGPTDDQRRVALTVLGQTAFEQQDPVAAEAAFGEAMAAAERSAASAAGDSAGSAATAAAATTATARQRDLAERLAAAIYRQGEAERAAGRPAAALGHFERVLARVPQSAVAAVARFDAAGVRMDQKDWDGAARTLEDFRRLHPGHTLQAELPARLALVQLERGQWTAAATEFERLADAPAESAVRAAGGDAGVVTRSALHQAAELQERGGDRRAAARLLDRIVRQHPTPVGPAMEARWRLVELLRADGSLLAGIGSPGAAPAPAERTAAPPRSGRRAAAASAPAPLPPAASASTRIATLLRELVDADAAAGAERTDRTRALAGLARLELTEPEWEAYRQVALVEPLQRNLALKKQRLERLLQAYAAAGGEAPAAEVTTAATARTAALYQDFGRALMASQRPRGLGKAALEQYEVMLEEQAFPFEEKAIALHEANARRTTQGLYDAAVAQSLAALARLKPVRWGKTEQGEPAPAGETALARQERVARAQQAAEAAPRDAGAWARLGLAQRQAGRFAEARRAYERALSLDAALPAATLNLAILHDLYLGEPAPAMGLYQRYAALAPGEAPTVQRWVAELLQRQARGAGDAAAGTGAPSAAAARGGETTAPAANRDATPDPGAATAQALQSAPSRDTLR